MTRVNYDIIIPCGQRDVAFVHRVVEYMRKYLPEGQMIFIITNKNFFKSIEHSITHCNQVEFLDENNLVDGLNLSIVKEYLAKKKWYIRQGWYFQQFLKMGFALTPYAKEYYLSWDSDTLPLRNLNFFEDGHPIFTIKSEYHPAYFETMEKLIGIGKTFDFSFIAEHMVFNTQIMKELIQMISANQTIEGQNWIEKCIMACEFSQTDIFKEPYFSEFETYGTYVCKQYPELYRTRKLNTFRNAGYIRGRKINNQMLQKLSFDLDIASFEYGHTPPFPYNAYYLMESNFKKLEKFLNMPIKEIPSAITQAAKRRLNMRDMDKNKHTTLKEFNKTGGVET